MTTYRTLLLGAWLAACGGSAMADDTIPDRTVTTNVQMVAVGASALLDTYLSPERYSGAELRYISHTTRERADSRWSRQVVYESSFADGENRAGNSDELAGMFDFNFAMHHKWSLAGGRLDVRAGGMADVALGFVYNTRNGNNPAQAKASLGIGPSAVATYGLRLWKKQFTLRYEMGVPLVGITFSPNYGQSYYELFSLGNYDHNVVPTTLLSAPSMRQSLSVDFALGQLVCRLGYLGDYRQTHVNHLKYHSYSHLLMVGVVRKFSITHIRP